jgi:hypothetical protein
MLIFFQAKKRKEGRFVMLVVLVLFAIVVDAEIDCVPVESLHKRERYIY